MAQLPDSPSPSSELGSLLDDVHAEFASHVEPQPVDVGVSSVLVSTRSTWMTWLEVFVVVALVMPLYASHSLVSWVCSALEVHHTWTNFYLLLFGRDGYDVAVTLAAIYLSGESWSAFGIKKPQWLDVLTGFLVCVFSIAFSVAGVDFFVDILKSIFSEPYTYQLTDAHHLPFHARGWSGFVTLLMLAISTGLSEELMMRGYFLTRFERLLRSTWASVLLTTIIFAALHWPSGILNTANAFLVGVVYGIAFVWTRRLWPVAIAHAVYDLPVFLHSASYN